ncbi:hypothetical protein BC938DRAFT_473956 [Jimgerdemannia flammicorona]|uniref:Uncharacterized protein n=1 Tax=Jimgerdemannia flammicorona TaxID=994334 RepID=A0A433Q331_9FUNG|nr:hypothetical protein BC938DRAFT_473956 [Jimgerdemannia flammicorona]
MALPPKFLASLPMIPFALLTLLHLLTSLHPWLEPTETACKNPDLAAEQGLRNYYIGVGPIDEFLCWIVPFFQNTLKLPAGFAVHAYVLTLANAFMGIASVEGARVSLSKTIISWVAFFGVFGQLIGISIVVPLFWIPIYAYKTSNPSALNNSVSPARALAIPLSLFLGVVIIQYNIFYPISFRAQQNIIGIFMLAPAIPTLVSYVLTPLVALVTPASLSESRAAVRATHTTMALGNFAIHLYLVAYLREHGAGWAAFRDIIDVPSVLVPSSRIFTDPKEQANVLCSHFLLVDLVALTIAMVYWIGLESGVVPALATLAASFVVSPGVAVSAYAAWREGTVKSVQKKKQ